MSEKTEKSKGDRTRSETEDKDKEGYTPSNFIRDIIADDVKNGKNEGKVQTRFPPEPNGYLHIGHAKAIILSFGMAEEFGGLCNLRFDDTNPITEDTEYVESIMEDVRWLGFDWGDRLFYTSDYFDKLYEFAVQLVKQGDAYVDSLPPDKIREYRGDYNRPGKLSPDRDRCVEENLTLLEKMRAGEFDEGEVVLRAKIDMSHPNMNMRDPLIYRIRKMPHHRTGDKWCIYPMYDFAHGQSDAIEKITHSLCTLEFENHRPLYDWFVEKLGLNDPRPRQIEFARLNLSYTVMSKRKLLELIQEKRVNGWNDPRMPTICGLRRRGYTPEAIRRFCDRIGVAKKQGVVDVSLLEHAVRDHLNETSPRVMGVLNPLKVVITNFPKDHVEWFECPYFPDEPEKGTRKVPLTREVYVERDDFREIPPRKWRRLTPGKEVRLRYACYITCNEVVKDPKTEEVVELRCTWDPESKGGWSTDGRKVRGTSHWVSVKYAVPAEVRIYDRLFKKKNPMETQEGETYKDHLNEDSLEVLDNCFLEPSLKEASPGDRYQFERLGYFCVDTEESTSDHIVFNRTISLRDSWARKEKGQGGKNKGGEGKQKKGGDKRP